MMVLNTRKLLHPPSALPQSVQGPIPAANNASGGLTFIALLWCVIAFPTAAHFVPTMIAAREWLGLLAPLAFVGVGVGLLALVAMSMLGRVLHGLVVLNLDHPVRVGEPFAGAISFPRRVGEGDRFLVKLECEFVRQVSLANRTSRGSGTVAKFDTLWSEEVVRPAGAAGKLRFVFAPPPDLPGTAGADGDNDKIRWRVWVTRQNALRASSSFTVPVGGPAPDVVAISRLLPSAADAPKATKNPWVVYGLTGVAIAVFAGALLFAIYQYASGLIQFVAQLFS
jgi:hypothetical protein